MLLTSGILGGLIVGQQNLRKKERSFKTGRSKMSMRITCNREPISYIGAPILSYRWSTH